MAPTVARFVEFATAEQTRLGEMPSSMEEEELASCEVAGTEVTSVPLTSSRARVTAQEQIINQLAMTRDN